MSFVDQTVVDSYDTLNNDLAFYVRYSYKLLWAATDHVATTYRVPWSLSEVYYPWNRTFEIGLFAAQS